MIDKKDIMMDYEFDVLEDFKPITEPFWIISRSGDYIWANRCFGFFKKIENPYVGEHTRAHLCERIVAWDFAVLDDGFLTAVDNTPGKMIGITFTKPAKDFVFLEEEIDLSSNESLKKMEGLRG